MSTDPPVDPQVVALVSSLSAHRPQDEREARSLATIINALATLSRPFDRHGDLTHVTASGVVVGPRGVLLHRHRRLHRWLQPGGHLEPSESPEDGARRESEEETGLVLRHPDSGSVLVHVDVHPAADDHIHLDIRYLLVGPDADPAPPPAESQEVRWFTWEEADAIADDALVGALRSARRLIDTGSLHGLGWTSEETDG
ncbi:MAG TPA: NUDIX domain-containing protein [Acidimicrobiales bacterium]